MGTSGGNSVKIPGLKLRTHLFDKPEPIIADVTFKPRSQERPDSEMIQELSNQATLSKGHQEGDHFKGRLQHDPLEPGTGCLHVDLAIG